MTTPVEQLAAHLNHNGFETEKGEEYKGGRGTHKLVRETVIWVRDHLGLGEEESGSISLAYPNAEGEFPYEK
ncbi:MAG TPA: hypothetical protein VFL57_22060 [Bryobacteraceae bacterium]|nr:hypothetical protein [Bryobacteraceae bacterium]